MDVKKTEAKRGTIYVQHRGDCPCCHGTYVEAEILRDTDGILVRRDTGQIWDHASHFNTSKDVLAQLLREGKDVYLSPHDGLIAK